MLQILCVNSCLTPSALSVQDNAYVGPQNLCLHWAGECHQPVLASRILDLGTALRLVAASGPVRFTPEKFMAVAGRNKLLSSICKHCTLT